MDLNTTTTRPVWESFKNHGVKVGYTASGIYTALCLGLHYLGEDMNRAALCAGLSTIAVLGCTLGLQYKLIKMNRKNYQV